MSAPKQGLGRKGEQLAADALQAQGMAIVERNYRCAVGEMDIIAREGDTLVFVEVKTRRGNRFGSPEDAVDARKQRKLIEVAETYLQERVLDDAEWRIDVVAVEMDGVGRLKRIEVIREAVRRDA